MILYTCEMRSAYGRVPGPFAHPCGRAGAALQDAGHRPEIRTVKGGSLKFWTWPSRGRDRAEIERLTGQRAVPVLLLDDGGTICGSGAIAEWARDHPA